MRGRKGIGGEEGDRREQKGRGNRGRIEGEEGDRGEQRGGEE